MPIILPTPEELAELDWHKRDKVVRAARRLLREYGAALTVDLPAEPRAISAEAQRRDDIVWGERVRAEARALLEQWGADPNAKWRAV
jgi:hypothetical protein